MACCWVRFAGSPHRALRGEAPRRLINPKTRGQLKVGTAERGGGGTGSSSPAGHLQRRGISGPRLQPPPRGLVGARRPLCMLQGALAFGCPSPGAAAFGEGARQGAPARGRGGGRIWPSPGSPAGGGRRGSGRRRAAGREAIAGVFPVGARRGAGGCRGQGRPGGGIRLPARPSPARKAGTSPPRAPRARGLLGAGTRRTCPARAPPPGLLIALLRRGPPAGLPLWPRAPAGVPAGRRGGLPPDPRAPSGDPRPLGGSAPLSSRAEARAAGRGSGVARELRLGAREGGLCSPCAAAAATPAPSAATRPANAKVSAEFALPSGRLQRPRRGVLRCALHSVGPRPRARGAFPRGAPLLFGRGGGAGLPPPPRAGAFLGVAAGGGLRF